LLEPIFDDKNRPVRWAPDYAGTPERKKMIEEAQRRRQLAIEAAKVGVGARYGAQ
jgi:hypothetical protein